MARPFLLFLLALLLPLGGCETTAGGTNKVTKVTTQDARRAAALISSYRVANGLSPVSIDDRYSRLAMMQSRRVAELGYLDHGDFSMRRAKAGVGVPAGENLAAGAVTVEEAVDDWKASSGHNRILLMPEARRMGLARAESPTGYRRYWTLVLGR